jgi:hypothetical protein
LVASNRLDEEIDRTIKRLMQVKTHKQVFFSARANASKVIEVPPAKGERGPSGSKSERINPIPGKVAKVA